MSMKIFVVFGSKSDETVQNPLAATLGKDFDVASEVISAHRDLEELQARLKNSKFDAIVAGAGLAAALPGVVAAMVDVPVFGVPVPNQFAGLDSFASIAQMPPGVPVMTAGPASVEPIVKFLKKYADAKVDFSRLHFVARNTQLLDCPDLKTDIEKARTAATEKKIEISISGAEDKAAFNVLLVTDKSEVRADDFCLHVPYFSKDDIAKPAAYLEALELANAGGLWVGVNNLRNAVHSLNRLRGAMKSKQERAA